MLEKLFWCFLNFFNHKFEIKEKVEVKSSEGVICIIVDYDAFSARDIKSVGGVRYKCGASSLDLVENKCVDYNIPILKVTTTDNESLIKVGGGNDSLYILNRGTDIAALEDILHLIYNYKKVIFCNSSAPYSQISKNIDIFLSGIDCNKDESILIGLNGNSRPSPAISFLHKKFPHLTSNFLCADVIDIKNVLEIGKNSFLYQCMGGYGNKYFAIRYFETLLSAYVLKKGGVLCCINGDTICFPGDRWFKEDSRIKEYSNHRV